MLRRFKIKVNGKEYLVEMEELDAHTPLAENSSQVAPAPASPKAEAETPAPSPSPAPPAPPAPVASHGAQVTAPMPGTILKLIANVGDQVSENQPILVLEAMKMENQIVAPQAGRLDSIAVSQGQSVNAGDVLFSIS